MKFNRIYCIAVALVSFGCSSPSSHQQFLPSWNDTPVKKQILTFLNEKVDSIPVANRIAVFDMDGTLVCEKPYGVETAVSVHRLMEQGETSDSVRQTMEYQLARKMLVNPRDTAATHHFYDNGQNYRRNIIFKPFDGADAEEYVRFADSCLHAARHWDHDRAYTDMFYQPMLELVDALRQKQFQVYVVSASMQGIVWGMCEEPLQLDRSHLIGIRHYKEVSFPEGGPVRFTMQSRMVEPVNNHYGKAINIYNQTGRIPVVAVGNAIGDFGMFHMASCSPYPHLALLLHHDDAEREYVYEPTRHKEIHWQDSVKRYRWLQADMSSEFKVVWKR